MQNYIVEMWGGDKTTITKERAEIIQKIIFDENRPEHIRFHDTSGRLFIVRVDQILKVRDGRTDLDIMMDNAHQAARDSKQS